MSEKIPQDQAEFFFRAAPGELPTQFIAADRGKRMAGRAKGEEDFTEEYPQSYGAHVHGWGDTPDRTPAGVFALAFLGRLERGQVEAIINGLHEIARIEGQPWAEQMAETLEKTAMLWRSR